MYASIGQAMDEIYRLRAEREALRAKIAGLFDAIKHGDQTHQDWLRAKIDAHFGASDQPDAVQSFNPQFTSGPHPILGAGSASNKGVCRTCGGTGHDY